VSGRSSWFVWASSWLMYEPLVSRTATQVTLPTATCRFRDDPGMVLLAVAVAQRSLGGGGGAPGGLRHARCSGLRESTVLGLYLALLVVVLSGGLTGRKRRTRHRDGKN
jgi:hypothetical protein